MLPALAVQKAEMVRQTAELVRPRLGGRGVEGYVEIGTTGRYVRALKRTLGLRGPVHLVSDAAPSGPVDVVERGQLAQAGAWVPLADYEPLPEARIASGSVQLVSCFIGLHHVAPERLSAFIASIHRVLAEGGLFVLRDHDVSDPSMERLVSLAHTVFNCGLGEPYAVNAAERRHFAPIDVWVARIEAAGFTAVGPRLAQANDPTRNLLLAFEKRPGGKARTP
jgi:SAM-dependent methyltransferase